MHVPDELKRCPWESFPVYSNVSGKDRDPKQEWSTSEFYNIGCIHNTSFSSKGMTGPNKPECFKLAVLSRQL